MTEINYEKNLVRKPVYELGGWVKGRQAPIMTYMSNKLVPGCNIYIELGWIYDIPEPNPHILEHSHDYEEVVLNIGGDPNNPEDLGAEIEFRIDNQPLTFDTTAAAYVTKGIKHGPLTWKRLDRPHLLMPIIIGAGTLAQAAPAGYKEK
jgi:hypothetical protein